MQLSQGGAHCWHLCCLAGAVPGTVQARGCQSRLPCPAVCHAVLHCERPDQARHLDDRAPWGPQRAHGGQRALIQGRSRSWSEILEETASQLLLLQHRPKRMWVHQTHGMEAASLFYAYTYLKVKACSKGAQFAEDH